MGEVLTNFDLNRYLTEENSNKSTAYDHPFTLQHEREVGFPVSIPNKSSTGDPPLRQERKVGFPVSIPDKSSTGDPPLRQERKVGFPVSIPKKSSADDHPGIKQRFVNWFWSFNDTSLNQKTPKKTKAVVTLEDLTKAVEVPTIRVKLKNPAKDKFESTFGVEECVGVLRKAESDLQLVQEPEKEALARNVKHLGAIFDSMKQGFLQKAEEFEMKLISLPLEQQKEFLVAWEAAGEIIGIVLDWLCEVFYVVLAKIREGYVIEKDVLNRIFKMGAEMLKELYSQPMNKCIQ